MASGSGEVGTVLEVSDLLGRLQLTTKEENTLTNNNDEIEETIPFEWSVIGKVLTQRSIHPTTIKSAMKPAWGNPWGLEVRSVGGKGDNLSIADFQGQVEEERDLHGSPWMVGKYASILQDSDGNLRPSDVNFENMNIWICVQNLPFGWMNAQKGEKIARMIGSMEKLDVDEKGKASGSYLRARVAIEINKPLKRGLFMRDESRKANIWYEIQYKKLPFCCKSCGIIGHFELECPSPALRNAEGRLPYDVSLRAPEDKRRKMPCFGEEVSELYGSGSSFT
ncbi:hypothetical protein QOZ80_1AG0025010 [Eleusine coracana subsp. coracana]|nr:hypothetical protein QOZ80_1AG0025010 [Eleusine coracana subsp. coracana]